MPKKNPAPPKKNPAPPKKNPAPPKKNPAPPKKVPVPIVHVPDPAAIEVPEFSTVQLDAPSNTGRRFTDPENAIVRLDRRFRLAWFFRDDMNHALPGGAAFHARAWTALRVVREIRADAGAADPSVVLRRETLESLSEAIGIARGIVEDTTRPGDEDRKRLRFDVALQATGTLLKAAPQILSGIEEAQVRHPALTESVIQRVRGAIESATTADQANARSEDRRAATRAAQSDQLQLATDVALECVDYLRAAARAAFLPARPKAAEVFISPLEPSGDSSAPESPTPKPAPT